jgi:hypothetical protein
LEIIADLPGKLRPGAVIVAASSSIGKTLKPTIALELKLELL